MLKVSYFFKFLSFLKYNFKDYKFLPITFCEMTKRVFNQALQNSKTRSLRANFGKRGLSQSFLSCKSYGL